jgi:hypothetical protein
MKQLATRAAALLMAALALTLDLPMKPNALLGGSSAKADTYLPTNPCAAPNEISLDPSQTAWELWVAATCPVNQSQYPYQGGEARLTRFLA